MTNIIDCIDIDIPDCWADDPELAGLDIITLGRMNTDIKADEHFKADRSAHRRAWNDEGEMLDH